MQWCKLSFVYSFWLWFLSEIRQCCNCLHDAQSGQSNVVPHGFETMKTRGIFASLRLKSSWGLIRWNYFDDGSEGSLDVRAAWQSNKRVESEIWLNPLCVCIWRRERGRERQSERDALWWLSITRSAGPVWPRSSSWHPAMFLLLSGVIHKENVRKEKKIEKKRGRQGSIEGERNGGMWGETGSRVQRSGRQEEVCVGGRGGRGGGGRNDKKKSRVNKCVWAGRWDSRVTSWRQERGTTATTSNLFNINVFKTLCHNSVIKAAKCPLCCHLDWSKLQEYSFNKHRTCLKENIYDGSEHKQSCQLKITWERAGWPCHEAQNFLSKLATKILLHSGRCCKSLLGITTRVRTKR